jgi:hypothetical protein
MERLTNAEASCSWCSFWAEMDSNMCRGQGIDRSAYPRIWWNCIWDEHDELKEFV